MKKKNETRLLALLLVLAMSISLYGCGTAPAAASASASESTAAASASADATSAAATESAQPANGPLVPMSEPIELTAAIGFDNTTDSRSPAGTTPENQTFNKIMESMNIKIKWLWTVPSDQFEQKFNLSVSSGDVPDIMKIESKYYMDFLENDMLTDMKGAYDEFALPEMKQMFEYYNNTPIDRCTVDGKLYSIPYVADTIQQCKMLYLRQDWLDKLGLKAPTTMDELVEVAEAFAKMDPDGNKTADTIGLSMDKDTNDGFSGVGVFQGFGSYNGWLEKDGQLVSGIIQPETKSALLKLREMYTKGAIDKEFAVTSVDQVVEKIVAGKIGMVYGEWWIPNWPLNLCMQKDPTAVWTAVPLPSANSAPAKTFVSRNNIWLYNVVSKNAPAKAAEAAMKIMNVWWDIQFSNDAATRYGAESTIEGGYVFNWAPIYTYMGNEQDINYSLVNTALDKKSKADLVLPQQIELYDDTEKWLNGTNDEEDWKAWGMWFSRVAKQGGMGLTIDYYKKNDLLVYNEYYGDPTPTEVEKGSTLREMTMEFFNKFIMGSVEESGWDKFVSDWKSLGGDDMTKEVNDQYSKLKK